MGCKGGKYMMVKPGAMKFTPILYPKDKTIIDLFEEHAVRCPGGIALVFEEKQITYKQLNERANMLARYLRSRGVKQETPVPVCIERSVEMIVAILGILKSGGAYVPIDPEYPENRMQYILDDIKAGVLLTSKASMPAMSANYNTDIILIDDQWPVISNELAANLPDVAAPQQLAYLIYTSGSTGKPKGVMIQHNSLMDYVFGLKQKVQIDQCRSFALVSTISADLGNTVLYSSLAFGGTLHFFSKEAINDIDILYNYFQKHTIDCLKIVPSHWEALCTPEKLLLPAKLIIFGGEALRAGVVETIHSSGSDCTVINHYGPTEATIGKLLHVAKKGITYNKTVPIGRPFSNTQVYVLNEQMALCPEGVAGQLYIAGDGVARGYYNNIELTNARFIKNPFGTKNSAKMYCTGDLVKYLSDGEILFIGRADDQVKIRGYRVELGEIESILMQSELVAQAVVLAREDDEGRKRLTGYIVPNELFDKKAIISYLQSKLPDYMVPLLWVQLARLPLTPNGKINRKALPEPGIEDVLTDKYEAPQSELEQKLAEKWQHLLEIKSVGIHDNFFDLGGDSLLAIRLISAVRKDIKAEISISSIFDHPTIAMLAAQIQNKPAAAIPDPIEIQSKAGHVPLSFNQESLWFIDSLEGSTQYHLPKLLKLKGRLDEKALAVAFKQVIDRHEILRTVIIEEEGSGRQVIKPSDGWHLTTEDVSTYQNNPQGLDNYVANIVSKPFDLSKDYILRVHLLKLQASEYLLVTVLHHIASDGWSVSLIVNELTELYAAQLEGRETHLLPMAIQYADYALWQRKYLQGELWGKKVVYWKDKLSGVSPINLPTDFVRPAVWSKRGSILWFDIDKELKDGLLALSRQQGTTLFMTLLSAFKVLLYRYSNQEDICVGTAVAGRQQQEVENLIGFFVNTLALRSEVNGNESFTGLLQQVRANTLEAYSRQEVPFEKVVSVVVKERDMSRNPIFQVMFLLDNTPQIKQSYLGDAELTELEFANQTAMFDLTFNLIEKGSGLRGEVEYCTDLYTEATMLRMIAHYQTLLGSVIKQPDQKIGMLPLLAPGEEAELLVAFNDTKQNYADRKSISNLFEEQAAKTPDNIAVEFEGEQLTYRELNEKANQLAHYLRVKGLQDETLVPVCIERSTAMVVAILGILKAGGAYVPIDPDYPEDRIHYMLDDTSAKIVVSNRFSRSKLPGGTGINIIEIDTQWPVISKLPAVDLPAVHSGNLAYVIYTSGSTGKPKGVMIEHKAVVNFILSVSGELNVKSGAVFLTVTTYSFDIFCLELYTPLLNGGKLIIAPREAAIDGFMLADYISRHRPTHMQATPPTWRLLINAGWQNTENVKVITGGEAVQEDLKDELAKRGTAWNMYGPTEATICSTYRKMSVHEKVLIGKPYANTVIHIISKENQLAPIGVAGEICIAGDGLARGYLNNAELTAQKFVKNPFKADTLMYRTGDLGRWLPDGNIEYYARMDDQVKVRGYRIELGEIESVALRSGLVKQVVVMALDDKQGSKRLAGYAVQKEGFNKDALIAYLKLQLPDYMVPTLWVELDSLPLTPNGKIDRKSLPEPETGSGLNGQYEAPRSEEEQKVADVWQEVLGAERIGVFDDFFDLGGHSLMVMRVISIIRKKLEVELAVKDLFTYPTVASLSGYIVSRGKGLVLPAIDVQSRPVHIPLSFSQERLWFIDRLEGSIQYHSPKLLRLKGILNQEALEAAFKQVVARHEILRTVILEEEGSGRQSVMASNNWQLTTEDVSAYKNNAEGLDNYIAEIISIPFDLSKHYMLRVHLLRLQAGEHLLVMVLHHIASDGWSISVIVNELAEFYAAQVEGRQAKLQPMVIQYADYALWQRKYLLGELWDKKVNYWKDKLNGVSPINLSTDFVRPAVWSKRGAIFKFNIDKELKDKLKALSRQQGATLFMTLLAAFKVLLYRYSGQDDICVGTAVAGRQQREVESLIGFFVNTLALRNRVNGDESFTDLLQQIRANTLEAYSYQEVPFEKVVEAVVKERDMSRNPIFQVMFMLQNTPDVPQLHLGDTELKEEEFAHHTAKFDLTFNLIEAGSEMKGVVEYCTDLYSEATVSRMIDHYKMLLVSVADQPDQKTGRLPMLSPNEENELLITFNDTYQDYPQQKSIAALFEEQAAKSPDKIAIEFEGGQLTYLQLNERANQLACYLKSQGVQNETLVPVCIERSAAMLIAILGILKAEGAYVPIDPDYPADRIHYMLEDTGAKIVVSSGGSRFKIPALASLNVIEIDTEQQAISTFPTDNLSNVSSEHLAYVIYTSGSTGMPKGVMITHRSVVNLLTSVAKEVAIKPGVVFLSVTTYSFDICYLELYTPLIYGGKLIIASREAAADGFMLAELIAQHRPTHIQATPSTWRLLINAGWQNNESVKILTGGEALQEDVKLELTARGDAWNMYGPTETTIWSTFKKLSPNEKVLIGKPLANTSIHVISKENQLVPVGVAGEICIAGDGLARGYLNREDLTAQKFVKNPFRADTLMYRTGDLGRWLPDGNLEYLTRMDDQVKVRGYRIELGEIESVVLRSGLVKQAVVAARDDREGSKRLVGYTIRDESFNRDALVTYLKTQLPDYMVPALWVELESLPLTPNGKIDRKSLPEPEVWAGLPDEYEAPGNEEQQKIADIWQEVLGIERMGINDNFFDLGGYSLLALKIISRVEKATGKRLPVSALFEYPTVKKFAELLKENRKISKLHSLVPIKTTGDKKPLYIVSGINGTAFAFVEFANMLDADQPVFILQEPQEIEDIEGFPDNVEEISAIYITQILKQNPNGPYALAGHCFGGIIAFEMTKQLENMGKEVNLLALFDTVAYKIEPMEQGAKKNLHMIKKAIQNVIFKSYKNIKLFLHDRELSIKYRKYSFMQFTNRLKRSFNSKNDERYEFSEKVTQLYERARKNYKITNYNRNMKLFRAKMASFDRDDKKYLGWKPYTKSVEVHEVEGDHLTMLKSKDFANLLQENLDQHLNS
ncbi:MAG: amino acid adenylation domain protein [Mucilaginibacter sp.]|nr:amino acid adenylation domain protein [Mucilaginibacter sp.]